MLRIKIELVPFGDESQAKEIHRMVIANTGQGDADLANYEAWIGKDNWTKEAECFGKIDQHPRAYSVWLLVKKAIDACLSGKYTPDSDEKSLSQRLKARL